MIAEEDIHAYVDGQLPLWRAAQIRAEAEREPELARRIAELRALNDRLRREFSGPESESLPPRLRRLAEWWRSGGRRFGSGR